MPRRSLAHWARWPRVPLRPSSSTPTRSVRASTEISFEAMVDLTKQATDVVLADPAVAGVATSVGTSGYNASANRADDPAPEKG